MKTWDFFIREFYEPPKLAYEDNSLTVNIVSWILSRLYHLGGYDLYALDKSRDMTQNQKYLRHVYI